VNHHSVAASFHTLLCKFYSIFICVLFVPEPMEEDPGELSDPGSLGKTAVEWK